LAAPTETRPDTADSAGSYLWNSVKDFSDETLLKRYLAVFPGGAYVGLARAQVDDIAKRREQVKSKGAVCLFWSDLSIPVVRMNGTPAARVAKSHAWWFFGNTGSLKFTVDGAKIRALTLPVEAGKRNIIGVMPGPKPEQRQLGPIDSAPGVVELCGEPAP
jgi:hypothetical protein